MHDNDYVSINISFEENEKDAGGAVKSLAATLRGATALQRAVIEPKTSPPAEGTLGGVTDTLAILAGTGLAPYVLDYAVSWWKNHHPTATMTITFDSTTITEKVRSLADFERVSNEFKQILLAPGGAVA